MASAPISRPADDAGARHEQHLAAQGVRKDQGSYYTPADVVEGVLDLALDPLLSRMGGDLVALRALRVIDPACGSGNFLVAAGRRVVDALVAAGCPPGDARRHVAGTALWGVDIDPRAVDLCRTALADGLAVGPGAIGQLRVGDALLDPALAPDGSFDLVVGNPPFLSQLGRRTARSGEERARLRARFGDAVAAYTDPAAAFAVLAVQVARGDGGVVALVEPISFLTARDAAGARAALVDGGTLTDLWALDEPIFDAAVEVCVPVAVRGGRGSTTSLHRGRSRVRGQVSPAPRGAASWSGLLADLHGLPHVDAVSSGTLGDLAAATADFRDQFYGLAPHAVDREVADDASFPALVTSGLIDPAVLRWGQRTTRFNKVTYRHPRVDLAALPPALRAWAAGRLVPKVLLATQTRVLEAVVDEPGRLLPSVPVITVVATGDDPFDLWRIGAVLTCPVASLVAARRHLGSGRNARAMRLRAAEVLDLPLPGDRERWDDAAALLRSGRPVTEVGAAMDAAYGVDVAEVVAWWLARMPSAP